MKALYFLKIISRILQKLLIIFSKYVENLSKIWNINFQKWFPKYNFKYPKYIKNIEVWSLGNPDLEFGRKILKMFLMYKKLEATLNVKCFHFVKSFCESCIPTCILLGYYVCLWSYFRSQSLNHLGLIYYWL